MTTRPACYCTSLRRAAGVVTRLYDDALSGSGLRATQFSLLSAVDRLGAPNLTVLAEETMLDRSTLGRNVRVLAKQGMVRLDEGADERTRLVALTAKGRQALAAALPAWREAQRIIDEQLRDDDGADPLDRIYKSLVQLQPADAGGKEGP